MVRMIPIFEFLGGCIVLTIGADRFLQASIAIARRWGIPSILVGVLLVGFGTSFSEIIVAIVASVHQKGTMAIGNVLGSNVANIGMVAGIAALIRPLAVRSRIVKRELPILVAATLFVGILLWHTHLGMLDGILLLAALCLHVIAMICWSGRDKKIAAESVSIVKNEKLGMSYKAALFFWPLGLVFLYISSELIVSGATQIALRLHMSELLIGLTVVAIGTSLPELATIILSSMRNEHDIAIGSVVGSNIFNLLAVLAMPALIHPSKLPKTLMHVDYPLLLGFTFLFYIFVLCPFKASKIISRIEGGILLAAYVGYLSLMFYFG